jgi:hypothetical protein
MGRVCVGSALKFKRTLSEKTSSLPMAMAKHVLQHKGLHKLFVSKTLVSRPKRRSAKQIKPRGEVDEPSPTKVSHPCIATTLALHASE